MFIDFVRPSRAIELSAPPRQEWPDLLNAARDFSFKHPEKHPKFAILRLWSAPHFWTLSKAFLPRRKGVPLIKGVSFRDPLGRSWRFRCIPKDWNYSEHSMYQLLGLRLWLLALQFEDRVIYRGDVILVMGIDASDLLRYVVAVTFAVQTNDWRQEIDLWKSFVNVDLKFLEGLDSYWLD